MRFRKYLSAYSTLISFVSTEVLASVDLAALADRLGITPKPSNATPVPAGLTAIRYFTATEDSGTLESNSILFLSSTSEFFFSHRLPLAKHMVANGWKVLIVTDNGPHADRLAEEGFTVHKTRITRTSDGLLGELRFLAKIVRLLRKHKPTIVHNIALKAAVFGSLGARWFSRAAIVNSVTGLGLTFVERDGRKSLTRIALETLMRASLSSTRCFTILQNPDDLDLLVGMRSIKPENATLIYGSGVDPELYKADSGTDRRRPIRIVLAARLLWSKGVGEFVEAANKLASKHPDVEFLIAGKVDTASSDHIPQEVLESWNADANVRWTGFVHDMVDLLSSASIVVLPSYYREGVPKVLIEAAMIGRPIVTTDAPGCREAVVDGQTGLLVPTRDAHTLAEALDTLICDDDMRVRFGSEAREMAIRKFSLENVLTETTKVYRRSVAHAHGNRG